MGITERREREREEVRRKILDAARDLFATEGYDKVTMRGIADAIEYSPTTIYNHFEDKDDVVDSLCREDFSRLLAHLGQGPLPVDPVVTIRQLGRAYAGFGKANPNHYRFMFMTQKQRDHDLSEPGQQAFLLLHSAVRQAVKRGLFVKGDVDTMAQVLWASIHGAVALLTTYDAAQFPHAPAAPDLVEQVIDNGIRGFAAAPRPRARRARR
jgi:AcrR family transcriptional regulator